MKEVTMIKLIFISIALLMIAFAGIAIKIWAKKDGMIAFAGIAIKIWAKKDGAFSGTCASNNPMLQEEGASCGLCGATPEEKCKN